MEFLDWIEDLAKICWLRDRWDLIIGQSGCNPARKIRLDLELIVYPRISLFYWGKERSYVTCFPDVGWSNGCGMSVQKVLTEVKGVSSSQ